MGIYVHGSIALGCFNWNKSDIDYIVVVNEPLTMDIKMEIMDITLKINHIAPYKGLEMSVVLKENCINFKYPTPFELHYSNIHREWYLRDEEDYCRKMNGVDEDLAAHFTIIKKCGLVLYGPPIDKVFGEVPKDYYIKSIIADVENAERDIYIKPIYIILNLCRIVAYLCEDEIFSKVDGGEWCKINLKDCYHEIIEKALNSYRTDEIMIVDNKEADGFCEYMLSHIKKYL